MEQVYKVFEQVQALDGLSLHVQKGTVYGLVGPNGAGKSTIIRHLTGVYRQDAGLVEIDGQPVYENPQVKARVFGIPDDSYYFPQADTRDMMRFYRSVYPNFDMHRYERLKEVFSIDERQNIRKLSKGMQKQVAFWLAICTHPDVLLLDEPVDGLDPVMRRQVWSIIMGDVAENGTTVLISSHNLRELEDVCDHVGILHQGKLILERNLAELQDNIVKVQLVLPAGAKLPESLQVLHESAVGKVSTIIVRGQMEEVCAQVESVHPMFYDVVPLSLEEIFIYELGGAEYAVKEILL